MDPKLHKRIDEIEEKLDLILKILNTDVKVNCEKMSDHINFVDSVYDNVKHPLGFLCSKLNILSSSQKTTFTPLIGAREKSNDDN